MRAPVGCSHEAGVCGGSGVRRLVWSVLKNRPSAGEVRALLLPARTGRAWGAEMTSSPRPWLRP